MPHSQIYHRRTLFRRVHILIKRLKRLVVADIFEVVITSHPDDIIALIHTISCSKNKLTGSRRILTQKGSALHDFRHGNSGKIQNRGTKIN